MEASENEETLLQSQAQQQKQEFTKPTINQMVKEKRFVPISYNVHIDRKEFEGLYDEVPPSVSLLPFK